MSEIKIGDRVRIKVRKDWPMPPGYRFSKAEGTVVKWVDWDEPMKEFQDYYYIKLDKTGEGAKEFIGKNEFFRKEDLEKI